MYMANELLSIPITVEIFREIFLELIAQIETVARLQRVLLGSQLSFVAESRENSNLTFESAATVGQKLRLTNLALTELKADHFFEVRRL